MNPTKSTPIYNLKAVVQETGIKPDTLRAWERRYGIPTPQRAESGHRLYSQNDIEMLHWLMARQEEGLSISRAIEMWTRLHEGPDETAEEPLEESFSPHGLRSLQLAASKDGAMGDLRRAWVAACMRFDEQDAEQILSQAFAFFSPETVCIELLQRSLAEIGDGWYRGEVTVQQEHFASALALRRLEALLASTPAPTRGRRILIACPPEEEHTFVPLVLALLLRRRSWDVVYLGANVPLVRLGETVAAVRPRLAILTAQQLHTAANLLEMGRLLYQDRVAMAFGGLIFNRVPDLQHVMPGYFLGERLNEAVARIEQILTTARPQEARLGQSHEYQAAAATFAASQARIEADVWMQMNLSHFSPRMLATANEQFSRNIAAALALGDMRFLGPDIDWVEGLLTNHIGMPAEMLEIYLGAYLNAMQENLGEPRHPAILWLSALLGVRLDSSPGWQTTEQTYLA
jgi:DNA-binding transcriptional MerR regulator